MLFLFGPITGYAEVASCSAERSIRVQKQIELVKSWGDAATFYKNNKTCIDGGLSEEYTNLLAAKLAEPSGIETLWKETKMQPWFRSVVSIRLQSETIPLETTEVILQNFKDQCPRDARSYCRNLSIKIVKSCLACKK